jgi:hypothetical protein
MGVILQSTITSHKCGHVAEETMLTGASQLYYECKGCVELLKPLQGDSSVFCCFGSVPCPPGRQKRLLQLRLL